MPSRTRFIVASFMTLGALACSAADPTTESDTAQTSEAVTTCSSQFTCCVGASQTFDTTDPFQAQLSAWHCSPPRVYQPNQASPGTYWFWTLCQDSNQRVESYLAANPKYTSSPWYAVVNPQTPAQCVPVPAAGVVNVLYDPTCSTCKTD